HSKQLLMKKILRAEERMPLELFFKEEFQSHHFLVKNFMMSSICVCNVKVVKQNAHHKLIWLKLNQSISINIIRIKAFHYVVISLAILAISLILALISQPFQTSSCVI